MKILVTGGSGQVGGELARYAWPEDVRLVLPNRAELDLSNSDSLAAYVLANRFDAVINAGAYTAVDKAESDVLTAWKVNALAPAALAAATSEAGIPLIHVSTDYVFDGTAVFPYGEDDRVSPLGIYGASKEAGEQAVRTGNSRHLILRTAWVFSSHGNNFVKTMLRLGKEKSFVRVVDDQHGSPTSAKDIADVLAKVTLNQVADRDTPTGTYHFVNEGRTTWCGFAREIFNLSAAYGGNVPALEAITTEEYPTPAKRPKYSCLATDKITRDYGITPRGWRESLSETLKQLHKSEK
ncbi:dTDP-4-dehydrorhamnose reductase [Rhizobium terrae]|uniref:dTDP-4-dehydrorhamnose reductase n=1 Tax=Rhizobium terrae TaxID=2171756 RepID=UPI000E3BDF9C|nr:dTDP-4-dehydrorhamnose reductase [Rhizobium terrae]